MYLWFKLLFINSCMLQYYSAVYILSGFTLLLPCLYFDVFCAHYVDHRAYFFPIYDKNVPSLINDISTIPNKIIWTENNKYDTSLFSVKALFYVFVSALNSSHSSFILVGIHSIFLESEKVSYKDIFPFNPGSVLDSLYCHINARYTEWGWKCEPLVTTCRLIDTWGQEVQNTLLQHRSGKLSC
jgi:hypothetical protein